MALSALNSTVRTWVGVAAIASLLPYTILKILWLGGSKLGMKVGAAGGHMQDVRMEIGNVVTVVLAVIGAGVVLALIQRWGQRLPWWVVLVPAAGATGTLAPIALGLPVGVLLQSALEGNVRSGGEGDLQGGVFALVYGGFGVFGIALAVLFVDYLKRRWPTLMTTGPRWPHQQWVVPVAWLGMLPLVGALWFWAANGASSAGLAGWESLAQRTVLVVIGLLVLSGLVSPYLARWGALRPAAAWMVAWIGCCVAAVQGPVLLLLSRDGTVELPLLFVTILATPSAVLLASAMLRHRSTADRRK
ncbi:MAG: hypothetical protein DI613_11475 [Kocuria rhizophila]|nr:MAG: hypothetical protein DI613_11475 [Kocuria rhizophila]